MNDITQLHLNQLFNRLSGDCNSARTRIGQSATMRAVKLAANVQASAMIRSLPQTKQELRRIHECAEKRMEGLLDQQLKSLGDCQSSQQLREEYGRLVRNDWIFLRGDFGRLYVNADRKYHQLLHKQVELENQAQTALRDAEVQPEDQDDSAPAP